MKFCIKEIV